MFGKYVPAFMISTLLGLLWWLGAAYVVLGCGMAYGGCRFTIQFVLPFVAILALYLILITVLFKKISKGTTVRGLLIVFTYPFLLLLLLVVLAWIQMILNLPPSNLGLD